VQQHPEPPRYPAIPQPLALGTCKLTDFFRCGGRIPDRSSTHRCAADTRWTPTPQRHCRYCCTHTHTHTPATCMTTSRLGPICARSSSTTSRRCAPGAHSRSSWLPSSGSTSRAHR
jgi:hypothetical protein